MLSLSLIWNIYKKYSDSALFQLELDPSRKLSGDDYYYTPDAVDFALELANGAM